MHRNRHRQDDVVAAAKHKAAHEHLYGELSSEQPHRSTESIHHHHQVNSATTEQEKLELDLADEIEMKACLDTSIKQLEASVKEIEKRLDGIADESNEWKTRFETQADMNKFLDRKIVEMQAKADTMRKTLRTGALYETNSDASYFQELVDRLEMEKTQLENQLSDLNWKLDKETKAFIKANDERKQYYLEISTCSSVVEDLKAKMRLHRKQTDIIARSTKLPPE